MKVADVLEAENKEEATAEEPTQVQKDTAEVAQHIYPFLVQKIEKINKRARKNKLPEIKLDIIKEYSVQRPKKPAEADYFGDSEKVQIPYYTVKMAGEAPKIAGYKFIATIEHQEGGNIIRTVPGEEANEKIKQFFEAKPHYCDHCKKVRTRVDTFVIKEEKTGKLRQVGRNCLADFLGGADPKAILWYFNNRENFGKLVGEAEEMAERRGGGVRIDEFIPLESVLHMGAALVREFGYMSSKKAQEAYEQGGVGLPTTASDLRWVLFSRKRREDMNQRDERVLQTAKNPTAADKKHVEDMLTWFANLPEQQKQSNEFMHNLDVIAKSNKVNARNIGYAVAMFPVYARAMDLIKQKEKQPKKSNEYIGQPGQKLPPTKVKVIRTRNIESHFGYRGSTTQIVSMEDQKGNVLVWFNNSQNRFDEGDDVTITGTIKKHDEWNGRKQTHLTRVKAV